MSFMRSIQLYGSILKVSLWNLRKRPFLFKPFFYLALVEFFGLICIYFAPQWPLRILMEKPLKAFFGERALHFPFNLLVLPVVFRKWQAFASVFFGSLFTGVAISMLNQKEKKMSHRFMLNLKIAFHRYFSLLAYGAVIFLLIFLFERYTGEFVRDMLAQHKGYFLKMGQIKWGVVLISLNVLFNIMIEVFLLYVPVLIIVANWGFWKSVKNSIEISKKYPLTSFLLVAIPLVVYLPVAVAKLYTLQLMHSLFPEISIVILLIGIGWMFLLNTFIAVSSTLLYLSIGAHHPSYSRDEKYG